MSTNLLKVRLLGLVLAALLLGVTGCGEQYPTVHGGVGPLPDSVQIAIHLILPRGGNPVVTLANPSLVQHLYNTMLQLPDLPENAICPTDMGPSYTLTFLHQGRHLLTATAQRYGCETVSIAGLEQEQQADQGFWSLLDQDISLASPPATPVELAILHRVLLDQLPETALLTSASLVEDLIWRSCTFRRLRSREPAHRSHFISMSWYFARAARRYLPSWTSGAGPLPWKETTSRAAGPSP